MGIIKNYYLRLRSILSSVKIDDRILPSGLDVLFFCHDFDRGLSLFGKAYSPLIDSVRDVFESNGFRSVVVAHPYSVLVGERSYGDVYSINRGFLLSYLKNKLYFTSFRAASKDHVLNYYVNLLMRTQVKLVITIGAPSQLCKACKILNIKHAEILHGLGYTKIEWGWEMRSVLELPSYVLSLDRVSTRVFKQLENKNLKVLEIQHPFLRRFAVPKLYNDIPLEWKVSNKCSYKKRILVLLQWGYGGECRELAGIIRNFLYPEELECVIKKTKDDVEWCFRLHPVQIRSSHRDCYMRLLSDLAKKFCNVKWEKWSELPLPSLLSCVDGCISMSSMAVYEAAYFGINSFLMCPTIREGGGNQNSFLDLVDAGYVVKKVPSVDNILDWVYSVRRQKSYNMNSREICNITDILF